MLYDFEGPGWTDRGGVSGPGEWPAPGYEWYTPPTDSDGVSKKKDPNCPPVAGWDPAVPRMCATPYGFHRRKGPTPTRFTGPDADHTYGNGTGDFYYAEASNKSSVSLRSFA